MAEELLFTTGPLIVAAVIAVSTPTVALFGVGIGLGMAVLTSSWRRRL